MTAHLKRTIRVSRRSRKASMTTICHRKETAKGFSKKRKSSDGKEVGQKKSQVDKKKIGKRS